MRVLLINPAHPAVSSRCHDGQMPPLGLLSVGGPLIDAGHVVRLIDGELGPLSTPAIVAAAVAWRSDVVLVGHSGSTSAHPAVVEIARSLKRYRPAAPIVYGGVFPTYHAAEILAAHPEFDVVVRGEGERTTVQLLSAIESGTSLSRIRGIAYRKAGSSD